MVVLKIAFINRNIFILLSNGEIFSRGNGDCLGRKSTQNINEDKLNKIIFFKNYNYYSLTKEPEKIIIYEISTGNNHVICLDNENNLWGWGDNTFHQVNPKNEEKRIEYPIIINFPKNNLKIFHIITPRNSTIIIDNYPQHFKLQKENGIYIKSFWAQNPNDRTLYDLIPNGFLNRFSPIFNILTIRSLSSSVLHVSLSSFPLFKPQLKQDIH